MSTFPSHDTATNTLAPIRTPLEFSLLLSSTVDVFELRAKHSAAANAAAGGGGSHGHGPGLSLTGDAGLLHAVDDRLAAYGFETNTGVRLVCVVDMRGRRVDGTVLRSGGAAAAAAAAAGSSSASHSTATTTTTTTTMTMNPAGGGGGAGLRDAELKPVFKAMQNAYVRLLQNPFYEPDAHTPPGGRGGTKITSKRFADTMRRIGESWTPGVTSL
ncbi:Longin-like protein [Cordyceps javanica]|uniref:Longin-like protein n=1 Tax=Cordyceps javanica TaxID=43265 RepID=A0A545URJ9_9HYPO|nr:Longin-like protein [Cordyceps javanica]TQW04126.1 Longin-like protein [Cordyceps javanica]